MSALRQKQTLTYVRVMSALPPKADIHWATSIGAAMDTALAPPFG
jgi:hypothetical protein